MSIFNSGAWFDWSTGWYEEFCLRGNIVYLQGWSIPGPDATTPGPFLATYVDGQPGQAIAKQAATEPYSFSAEVELRNTEGQTTLRYTDFHLWTPVADGWSHEEVFQWLTLFPGSGRAFHSFSLHKPNGWMYSAAHRTFIAVDGTVTHEAPIRTVKVWQW